MFTKQWISNKTEHYTLEITNDNKNYIAKKIETFSSQCLITDSDIFEDKLYLVGYTIEGIVKMFHFSDISEKEFFKSAPKEIFLGLMPKIGQVEGITISKDNIFVSAEEFKFSFFEVKPILYIIDRNKIN